MIDISKAINKVDNEEKITGKAVYIDDIKLEGMLYAKTLRSEVTNGRIVKRHYPKLPKDYYIVDYRDIPGNNYIKMIFEDMPVFSEELVQYYGEPIALVVGPDKQVILDIMGQIKIEYTVVEPIFDYRNSVIHYDYEKGKGENVFASAHRIIDYTYETGYQEHVYIEPQGVIGYNEGDKISILGSIQCPYYVKNALINTLGCAEDQARVVQTTTGGAFGGKEEFPSLIACQVAVAVKKIGRPIKLVYNRVEDMAYTTKRHPSKIKLEAAIDEENYIVGFRAHVSLDGGAYIGLSGVVLQRAMIAATGVYHIENLVVSGDVYKTNTVPTGAFRGFGAPQMIFAVEMFIHHIAKDLGIDPLIIRNQYMVKEGDSTSTSGHFRNPIILKSMIDRAKILADYDNKIQLYKKEKIDGKMRGIGMSWFLHGCGFTGSGEQMHIKAVVRLHKGADDIVTILVAAVDMGQGIKTTMRKLVAHVLELPIEQVRMENPDTDLVPDSGPTVASRTMMIVGGLVAKAAETLKENWLAGKEQEVEEKYKQPEYIQWDEDSFYGDAYPGYSWGVNIIEVEVSPVTYEVTLKGTWSVYDVGKAIDEGIIMGQADGGLLQGISYGMLEVMENKAGIIQQRTVTDYIIPTASDTVQMITELFDNPFPLGPYGAKGAGELTLIGGAPAVALAIENAIGKKVMKIPATPEYIMSLMGDV